MNLKRFFTSKKIFSILLKLTIGAITAIAIYIVGVLIYASVTDYKPHNMSPISENIATPIPIGVELSALSWNIGYAGMDCSIDFFYDGGKTTRVSKERTQQNLGAISLQLSQFQQSSFFLLQEVDRKSHRSYFIDQYQYLNQVLGRFDWFFATNYKVGFVPVPLTNPMGKVYAGLCTASEYTPLSVYRLAYPGSFKWPTRLFMLDRCALVCEFETQNRKKLVLINTHNSAFDDGSVKAAEMKFLRQFIDSISENAYVIAGGDWNQSPPDFTAHYSGYIPDSTAIGVPNDFVPTGWQCVYDSQIPTNRNASEPFNRESTGVLCIDWFLVSPNIRVDKCQTIDLQFKHSDHNPVHLSFTLL